MVTPPASPNEAGEGDDFGSGAGLSRQQVRVVVGLASMQADDAARLASVMGQHSAGQDDQRPEAGAAPVEVWRHCGRCGGQAI